MIKIKRIVWLAIAVIMMGYQAYGIDLSPVDNEDTIKNKIEKTYGINIIIPDDDDYTEFINILEKNIKKFPDNIIKEITDYYLNKGLVTKVILDKTEVIEDFFSVSGIDENTVNIYIKALESSLYSESCYASEQAVLHEFSHFISHYVFEIYDLKELEKEFRKLDADYAKGVWNEKYKEFVNNNSALSFEVEVAHLIWYAEANPSILRNINGGDIAVIHSKLRLLAAEFDKIFSSISLDTKLWLDAIPQTPQDWAKDKIADMKEKSLIPEEFNGLYDAYIYRGDFYKLILNMLHVKFGETYLNNYFDIKDYEEHLALDPVKGEVFVADGVNYTSYYNFLKNNGSALYEAYKMGILSMDSLYEPEGYISRLEIARLLAYIVNELGINISDYETVDYIDIDQIAENEKPFICIAAGKGYIKGDGLNFKPFDYCTYQEAYIIINRLYNSL